MKIAFVGKGGSGKTTIAALFCRHLAASGRPVIAIDADINQHLAVALGMSAGAAERIPTLGRDIDRIKDYLRGDNPLIPSAAMMIKTTPPGRGSRLISVRDSNLLFDHFLRRIDGVGLMAVGPFQAEDIGTRCYHSKTGAVELLLNHSIDDSEAHLVVDMTAGADAFASGLFTRFDLTVLVVEPTTRSLSVYDQYTGCAADHGIAIAVIGNKVEDEQDVAFIAERVSDDLVATLYRSSFVRSLEKGAFPPFDGLEPENRAALIRLQALLESQQKDWSRYQAQAITFHLRNAASWANAATGADLATQVDLGFSLADAAAEITGRQARRAA